MAQEEVKYTIANNEQASTPNDGAQVDVTFTYDPNTKNADGSFTVTGASGTYSALNAQGQVVGSDTITGVLPKGTAVTSASGSGTPDEELYIVANPNATPIVTAEGVGFTISSTADSNDGKGDVSFSDANSNQFPPDPPTDTPQYASGNNGNPATGVTETAVVCFASGTLIRTTRGQIAVEQLTTEDRVVTASGAERPIRWIGHRAFDCRRHPRPSDVLPVLVAPHAFGPDQPARGLRVSPGHSLFVDALGGLLIPAGALINGSTIVQEKVDSVTYWHVELDAHDVILAENMPAESYLEMGNRGFFAESGAATLHAPPDAPVATHADFCCPYAAEGPLVDGVRRRLATRARELASTNAIPQAA